MTTLGHDALGAAAQASTTTDGQSAELSVHEQALIELTAEVVQVVDLEMVDLVLLGAA